MRADQTLYQDSSRDLSQKREDPESLEQGIALYKELAANNTYLRTVEDAMFSLMSQNMPGKKRIPLLEAHLNNLVLLGVPRQIRHWVFEEARRKARYGHQISNVRYLERFLPRPVWKDQILPERLEPEGGWGVPWEPDDPARPDAPPPKSGEELREYWRQRFQRNPYIQQREQRLKSTDTTSTRTSRSQGGPKSGATINRPRTP